MTTPYAVEACSLEQLQLSLYATTVNGGSHASQVMMITYSLYLYVLTVKETSLGGKLHIAHTETRVIFIKQLAVSVKQLCDDSVQVRRGNRPQLGITDIGGQRHLTGTAGSTL